MNNKRGSIIGWRAVVVTFFAALVIFVTVVTGPVPAVSGQATRAAQPAPAAVIDKILINDRSQTEAFGSVVVTRAGGERVQPVSTGLLLYRGDVIETAANTKVTILFMDTPASEKHNQIILDADSKLGISSGDSWWGRVWTKVKGLFTSRTTYVQVGATGTEYELNVSRDGRQTTVIMLEGTFLDVTRGTFNLVGRVPDYAPPRPNLDVSSVRFVPATFTPATLGQEQPGRSLSVSAGELAPFEVTYNIFNECRQSHRFEFRTSDDTPWLQLEIQRAWDIAPAQRLAIKATLTIDARRLSSGVYRGRVYLVCLDCDREAQCSSAQVPWPYNVTVSGTAPPPTPSPSPAVTVTRNFRLTELEQAVIPNSPEPAGPERASDSQVREVLNWTNNVILRTQPTYSADSVIAHFTNPAQRTQNFQTAREQAILSHAPGSNKIVGDVYSDWGQPALAAGAYDKEVSVAGQSESFAVDRAEAYRLMGRPRDAADMVQRSQAASTQAGQNLLGNVYADYARADVDKRDLAQAKANLDQAEGFYRRALTQNRQSALADNTVQANLAKAQISQGDVILQEAVRNAINPQGGIAPQPNAAQLARTRYTSAMQLLANTQSAESTYPFGVQALGRAYQGLGDAANLAGEAAAARDAYANATSHFNRIISAHPDCAEAYFNLGDLYENLGDEPKAKENYRRAIQARPEQPASYYPLAMLLRDEDPRLAAALAAAYLRLEPDVFKQGEKARNAERITRGERVVILPTGQRLGQIKVATVATQIAVPSVLNMSLAQATSQLQSAGYRVVTGDRRNDPSPPDTVIVQTPTANTPAPRDSVVNLIVSLGPRTTPTETVVPDVRNMNLAQATSAIKAAYLEVGRTTEKADNSRIKGGIIKQKPEPGKRVAAGTFVELEVATSKPVEVPDIVDKSESEAREKIVKERLVVGQTSQQPSCKVGEVISQNPIKKTRVEPGSPVDFVVGSLGDNPVAVPQLMGARQEDAEMAIRERRFILSRVRTEETDNARPGTVMHQSPRAGELFAQVCPAKVEITVAIPLTTVGNYVGLYEGEARRAVSDAGLSAAVRNRESQSEVGRVLEQYPPAGSRVKRSNPVTLIVSAPVVELIPVPDVTRGTLLNAKNILEKVGLSLGRITYQDPPAGPPIYTRAPPVADPCTVLRQDPVPGRPVRRGTPVNLWVVRWKDGNCLSTEIGDR